MTLPLDLPPSEPHRAEIAKRMTRVGRRGRGIGLALVIEAERIARECRRSLLTLDTASDEGTGNRITSEVIVSHCLARYG